MAARLAARVCGVLAVVIQPSPIRATRLSARSDSFGKAGLGLAVTQIGRGCWAGLGSTVTFSNRL